MSDNFMDNPELANLKGILSNKDYKKFLEKYLKKVLPIKEADVLCKRFAIGTSFHTLKEIGQPLGLTRERIRQIEAKALRKLIDPNRLKKLQEYIANKWIV